MTTVARRHRDEQIRASRRYDPLRSMLPPPVVTAESVKCPRPSGGDGDHGNGDVDGDDFVRFSARCGISTRYDTAIVYAVDEVLTRGSYLVLVQWFYSYINRSNHPGCIVVVGYGDTSRARRTVDLAVGGGAVVPYVTLDAGLDDPIFEFKRCTGYPMVVLLLTLDASRLSHKLSCDGYIDVQPSDSIRKSCRRIAQTISHVVDRYLKDLHYDDGRRRTLGVGDDGAGGREYDDATTVVTATTTAAAADLGDFEDDCDAACSVVSASRADVTSAGDSCGSNARQLTATPYGMPPYHRQRPSVMGADVGLAAPTPTDMHEMLEQNERIMLQLERADNTLLQSSLYPDEQVGRNIVVEVDDS